jgi:hypothetical protein
MVVLTMLAQAEAAGSRICYLPSVPKVSLKIRKIKCKEFPPKGRCFILNEFIIYPPYSSAGSISLSRAPLTLSLPFTILRASKTDLDRLVKSRKSPFSVIPVQTGTQSFQLLKEGLDPVFQRGDDFLRFHQPLMKTCMNMALSFTGPGAHP